MTLIKSNCYLQASVFLPAKWENSAYFAKMAVTMTSLGLYAQPSSPQLPRNQHWTQTWPPHERTRSKMAVLTLATQGEFSKTRMTGPHRRLLKSDSLGMKPKHPVFAKLPKRFQWAAKVNSRWARRKEKWNYFISIESWGRLLLLTVNYSIMPCTIWGLQTTQVIFIQKFIHC